MPADGHPEQSRVPDAGMPVGNISASPMSLTASATDTGGSATVTLYADVIVTIDVPPAPPGSRPGWNPMRAD